MNRQSARPMIDYPFTEEQAKAAYDEWGCNCGPTALAFALQCSLDRVRQAIPSFAERGYTSPSMMRAALDNLGWRFSAITAGRRDSGQLTRMFAGPMTLVRIQWTGPWVVDGKPQRWAARQTHWIACWSDSHEVWEGGRRVFDCNGGMRTFESWQTEIVPLIVASVKRADGGWYPANIWRIEEAS